jgi:steroid 5-alpha reductase family enzyme
MSWRDAFLLGFPLQPILMAWLLVAGVMLLVALLAKRLNNAGLVDVVWGFGFAGLAGFYVWVIPGDWTRKVILGGLFAAASLRLGTYLLARFRRWYPQEDPRYTAFRAEWGKNGPLAEWLGVLGAFEVQGLLMWLVSLPMPLVFAASGGYPTELHWLEWLAIGLWMLGFLVEALADRQLDHFLQQPANKGKVCGLNPEDGLWFYSRHPNYFGEWLMWLSYGLFALAGVWLGNPLGAMGMLSPALMFLFIWQLTGVVPTEARALVSKGEAYRQYQATTSPFIPWFKPRVTHMHP